MNNPKISIIVPVYKAEKYIRKCLDSIIAQTFSDWECILVDDGSPDASGAICDEYSEADSRFRVFHKTNGGVSSARNIAINNISGEWVMFVDSDDYIASNTIEVALDSVNNYNLDLVQFSFSRKIEDLGLQDKHKTKVCSTNEYIMTGQIMYGVCGGLFNTSIIKNNKIRFNEYMKLGEDQLFLYTYMTYISRIKRIPNILYYYCDNKNSATNNEKIEDIIYSSKCCIEFKCNHPNFNVRMDGLVLYYIEKLLLRGEYKTSHAILSILKPLHYQNKCMPIRLMVKLSKYNVFVAIMFGALTYPIYNKYIKLCEKFQK